MARCDPGMIPSSTRLRGDEHHTSMCRLRLTKMGRRKGQCAVCVGTSAYLRHAPILFHTTRRLSAGLLSVGPLRGVFASRSFPGTVPDFHIPSGWSSGISDFRLQISDLDCRLTSSADFSAVLPDCSFLGTRYPALKRWAKVSRPTGLTAEAQRLRLGEPHLLATTG